MNSQELLQERLENTQYKYAENAKLAIVYHDPITNRMNNLLGSADMKMSMHEYAKLRVPEGIEYNIVTYESAPNEALPGLNFSAYSDKSLNMFYRYLNAL